MRLLGRSVRWRSSLSAGTVAVVTTALVALAFVHDGLPTTDVALNDSGVWVTRSQDNLVGRFNHEATAMDGAVSSGTSDADVLQQADAVLVHDRGARTVAVVDVAGVLLSGSAQVPEDALVRLGGRAVAVLDRSSGEVWVVPVDGAGSFSADATEPVAEVGPDGALAVGTDGTVHVAAGSTLVTVTTGSRGAPDEVREEPLDAGKDAVLAVTAVGSDAVVLDRSAGRLRLPGGDLVAVPDADVVALQQPGPAADDVLLADADGLVRQPLDGSERTRVDTGGSGTPAAPVQVAGCAYGAWTGPGAVVRDCPGRADDLVRDLEVPGNGTLRYRVNRDVVVLNELVSGSVWLATQDFELFDDWRDVLPTEDEQQDDPEVTPDPSRDPLQDRDKPNRPPVATDDHLGVRPGRTAVLKILDNDVDPDGDVLVATLEDPGSAPGDIERIHGGAAVQLRVPESATGASSFRYTADDGRGGTDDATVTLTVHPWEQNAAPEPVRQTVVVVEQGGSVQVDVLDDWLDPDGDDLVLVGATATTEGDDVRSRPDGRVTFQDAGTALGRKAVSLLVSDGQGEPVEGTLWVDVRATGPQPPVTEPDHVTTIVGQPVTVSPLRNDTDANGDPLTLARVDEAPPAVVTPDYEAGTLTFVSDVPRVYYLLYLVTDGPSSALGLIRVDVLPKPDGAAAPVAVRDTALLPAGDDVLVDVTANDVDPSGGVLVVQSAGVPPDAGVSVSVVEHHLLRVRELRALAGPVTVTYTVSNGLASAVGEVLVLPVPAPEVLRPPHAVDDEVLVRAGDVATIPVLANDTHPDDAELHLLPELVEVPDPAAGRIFTAQDTVRFRAGPEAGTVHAVYQVTDPQQQTDSAQITIRIKAADPAQNAAPRPRDLVAHVLAGTVTRIPVPLDGIDPDGDSVTLTGLERAPGKGRVTTFGEGWLEYEAGRGSSGVDTFTYTVEDTYGLRAVGSVVVGIAPPPTANQAPLPQDDEVTVRPGRTVAVPVLANDADPDGDRLGLVTDGLTSDVPARVVGERVAVEVPELAGASTLYYTVADAFGATAEAALTVTARADAPLLAPIARDDALTLRDVLGRTTVDVPVLENDEDPDGSVEDLDVAVADAGSTARALRSGAVRVTLADRAQVVTYTVTDADGLVATAFLRVPGLGGLRPTLRADQGDVDVVSGGTLTVDLADYVVVTEGRRAVVTEASTVRALRGTARLVDADTITFVSDDGYYGPAALTFEVTDGRDTEDPDGRKATLTLPIRVLPGANQPPTLSGAGLTVVAGEQATVDLAEYARDPDPDDAGRLRFAVAGEVPDGLRATVDGSELTVTAESSVPAGTTATLGVTVTDGHPGSEPVAAEVAVTVVATSRPLASANDDVVAEAEQGRPTQVDVTANDANPFPETPLKVVTAAVETGTGTARVSEAGVEVTPGADFVGTMVVRYRVQDATADPAREVDGRIRLTVQGKPERPLAPTVTEVRSRTVVLSWEPPVNNGSVITGYTVRSSQGYTRECPATTCTLDGLTNNVEYVFTVVAHNAVGDSEPSPPSLPARPDERPDVPDAPTLAFGDRSLTVSWVNRAYSDRSPIQSVTLEISPAPPAGAIQKVGVTGTSLVWSGLQNGVPYRVRVQAVNAAPEPSDWSAYSAAEIPAGVPAQPAAPSTSMLDPVGNQAQMQVSWPATDPNGDPVARYRLTVLRGGSVLRTVDVPGAQTSQAVVVDTSETSYTFTVAATNKAGTSAASPPSAPRRGVVAPGPVTGLSAAPGDNAVQLAFGAAAGNGATAGEIRYEYQVNGGGWNALGGDKRVTSGVPNNGTYTVGVRAVSTVDGADYAGPASAANPVAPFGAPGRPDTGANGNQQDVTLTWSAPARNGRDIRMQISIDDGGWQDVGASGSRTVGDGYEQTHKIEARAVDTEGQVSAVSTSSARSADRPAARVFLSKYGNAQGQPNCEDPSCQYVRINWRNMPAGTYRIQIEEDSEGPWLPLGSARSITMNGDGSFDFSVYFGYPGRHVRAVYQGDVFSEVLTW